MTNLGFTEKLSHCHNKLVFPTNLSAKERKTWKYDRKKVNETIVLKCIVQNY